MKLVNVQVIKDELERLIRNYRFYSSTEAKYRFETYTELLEWVDTLEVKEVDLEKEIDVWYQNKASKEFENVFYDDIEECAKHFFELGLKAKGE